MKRSPGGNSLEASENFERKPIADIEILRKTMESFWHRDISINKIKEQLGLQEAIHQDDLLRAGYEMSAFLRANRKAKSSAPYNFRSLIVASTSETKRQIVREAVAAEKLSIDEASLDDVFPDEEEESHRILRKLIQERRDYEEGGVPMEPTIRYFTPALYALDIAEEKMRNVAARHKNENIPILACDVVVLEGKRILEKPRDKEEAIQMLKSLSGKTVEISFGATLLAPSTMGEIVIKEAGRLRVHLRNFGDKEIEQYLGAVGNDCLTIAGSIDYAHPVARVFLDDSAPISVEIIEDLRTGSAVGVRSLAFSSVLLEKMKDYVTGVPREMIREIVAEGKILAV